MQQNRHPNSIDTWTGLLFIAIAGIFLANAINYDLGNMRRLGPGLFPLIIAGLLAVVGSASLISGLLKGGEAPGHFRLRAILPILAIPAFALSIKPLGLLIASALVVGISCRAEAVRPSPSELVLAIALAIACYGVFVLGLGLPLRLLPAL